MAFAVCCYEVVDRFKLFFSYTTSTSSNFEVRDSIDFPAVTFCNLNPVKKTFVDQHNLSKILNFVFNPSQMELSMARKKNFTQSCETLSSQLSPEATSMAFNSIINDQGVKRTDFIIHCSFGADNENDDYYDCTDQFIKEHNSLGVCYTFNSHLTIGQSRSKTVRNSGEKYGLRVVLNIDQDEYSTSLNGNAGIKLSINKFGNIPDLEEKGILVPPGMNAYIGLKTTRVIDSTRGRKCERNNPSFKYYQSESGYSAGVCKASKFAEAVDKSCKCLYYRTTSNPNNLTNCTVKDFCCLSETKLKHSSECSEPCDTTSYSTQTSYAGFPSAAFANELSRMLNLSVNSLYKNIVAVNIYFEEVGITVTETTNPYKSSDFLSDLGGTLGLFLGASVISLLELGLLVFDEIKDRTWKKSWKKKVAVLEHDLFDGHVPEVTGEKTDEDEQEQDEWDEVESNGNLVRKESIV